MEVKAPSPQTTLLILLGASEWPLFPEFQSSKAFANAAREVKAYFLDPKRFGLPPENVLDLFNSNLSADELDVEISQFLERRLIDMKKAGNPARDVLLYFVGHGGFIGHDADFYLAIRRTRIDNPRASGLQVTALADTLRERARFLRRIVILDCCFAAAAFSAFEAGPDQVAIEKTVDAFKVGYRAVGFPTKGTTLLCSSSHKSPSRLLPDGSSTMFTKAFLDTLVQGASRPRDYLTLREMKDLAADLLSETKDAPKPVVLSPDQSEGDVADIPFFPNSYTQEKQTRAEMIPLRPPQRGISRRTILVVLAGLMVAIVVSASIFVASVPSPPTTSAPGSHAQTPSCQSFQKTINEVETKGDLCPPNPQIKRGITVEGQVRDLKWDGWCARVKVVFSNGVTKYSDPLACGPGNDQQFGWEEGSASWVSIRLQRVCGNEKACREKAGSVGSDVLVKQYP